MIKDSLQTLYPYRKATLISSLFVTGLLIAFLIFYLGSKKKQLSKNPDIYTSQSLIPPPSMVTCRDPLGSSDLFRKLNVCLPQHRMLNNSEGCLHSQIPLLLLNCTEKTDHRDIACLLDVVRRQGEQANELANLVARFLPHQANIYQGRDKWHVLRLRAYTFITLSEIGFPESAMPMLYDALVYVDERMKAIEFGAAVRAAGTLKERGSLFIPHLLEILGKPFAEEEFSLERYGQDFPQSESTTVQLEVARSLASICTSKDSKAITVLQFYASSSASSGFDPRLIKEANNALQIIKKRRNATSPFKFVNAISSSLNQKNNDPSYISPWLNPVERQYLKNLDIPVVDHNERQYSFNQLIGKPILLTFFYTRCQNAQKCSATIAKLAMIQQDLRRHKMINDIRLIGITYEPEFDTPRRLKRFVSDRGMELSSNALTLKLDYSRQPDFVEELDTPVGYNAGWVNSHGIEVALLDSKGRLVRKYNSLDWNNTLILNDFRKLLNE